MRVEARAGPRIGIVGGGINGAGIAWELARRDYDVVLFEKGICGAQTSSATTKMIHGGLRYLEHLQFGLVRESLRERAWLLANLPELVKPFEIMIPLYEDSPRSRGVVHAGLVLYEALAGAGRIARHRSLSPEWLMDAAPLRPEGLEGGFSYWDAQVDDFALVRAVVSSAEREGADIRERTAVVAIARERDCWLITTGSGEKEHVDLLINAAGPWMNEWLVRNGITARYVLSLVRGTHLVLDHRVSDKGLLLQSTSDSRVFFALPWKETTLVGTTEVLQREPLDRVEPSGEEIDYLIRRFNHYFTGPISRASIADTFAGVRPLVGRASNPSVIGRDFRVVREGNLINVFGGKMTTFMSLARRTAMRVDNYFGRPRRAREAVFALRLESAA